MTPKSKQAAVWIGTIFGAFGGLAIVGLATQFWISVEVKAQISELTIPDTTQLTTDVAVIKSTVLANSSKADTALENQQRFEEIFTEYLINEASR